MKLFQDVIKDATANSVHRTTALGNVKRTNRNDRKRRDFDAVMAEESHRLEDSGDDDGLTPRSTGTQDNDILTTGKAWSVKLEFKKADPDKRMIFGWASVVTKDGKYIIDKQGDIIPVTELEKAAYEYVLYSRDQGDMHDEYNVGKLVESFVFTKEKQQALGIDLGMEGWWVGYYVNSDKLWSAIKRGDRPEFSIGGGAIPIDVEDLDDTRMA